MLIKLFLKTNNNNKKKLSVGLELGVVAHACCPSTQETKAQGS
jgi:hypothetical protein